MRVEGCVPKSIDHTSYPDEAFAYMEAGGGVAILTKSQPFVPHGRIMYCGSCENDPFFDERIASRADNGSKPLSEFSRSYNTFAKRMLEPEQMTLAMIGQGGSAGISCNH